jgi:uncharacterized protein YciI
MNFDRYAVGLLLQHPEAPDLSAAEQARLQSAHMSFLADLHEAGHLLVAGPVLGDPGRELRGLSILRVDAERARELKAQDPAVRAGRFRIATFDWMVPSGLMTFSPGRLPRSLAEVGG